MYLSVPMPDKKSSSGINISDCLMEFSKEEFLEKENSWWCEKCKKLQPAKKKIDIWKLPNILIICIKRFKVLKNHSVLKLNDVVNFPLNNLDLSPYVSSP